ncbi:hypothetical protein PO124_34310 [Bacillus licheniformis]|nr:hypothetical protein [Bacillus licheniformis]
MLATSAMFAGLMLSDAVYAAETPYYGKNYTQPEQVSSLYPEPEETFSTPAFVKEGEAFTTQEEMMKFITSLTKKSPNVKIGNIGFQLKKKYSCALLHKGQANTFHIKNQPSGCKDRYMEMSRQRENLLWR